MLINGFVCLQFYYEFCRRFRQQNQYFETTS